MKKSTFSLIFISFATLILLLIHQFVSLEKYVSFSLIPLMIAYLLGQYSERNYKN